MSQASTVDDALPRQRPVATAQPSAPPTSGTGQTCHELPGLRAQPLASYLAGLGLVRLLAEQVDPGTTAKWDRDGLVIESTVDDVAGWLTDCYVPTPVLSPWNGGGGFSGDGKTVGDTLAALLEHPSPRLAGFRAAIPVASEAAARQQASKHKDAKRHAVRWFRNNCPEELLPWIDATVVLAGEDVAFPPLLGTGGNDGRLDFSANFQQRLLTLFDDSPKSRKNSLAYARDVLAGTQGERLVKAAVGQFDPGAAGGSNSSPFGAADSYVNPWAYVLLVEGALLFAAGAARRNQFTGSRAAMPFTVFASPEGSASGAAGEGSRGEVWTPVWDKPFTLSEIRQLFGEARAAWRGRPAQRAVEFYAATRTLGVARGVKSFTRYALAQRNGLAFVAVPVEEVQVRTNPDVRLVAKLEDWAGRVRRADTSTAVGTTMRRFDEAHLTYVRDGGTEALARLLAALTDLEFAVGRSGRLRENVPVRRPPSAHDFLGVLGKPNAECAELRVAVGIASCATHPGADPARSSRRTMRQLLLPVDPGRSAADPPRWRDSAVVPGFGARPLRQVLADVLVWRSRTAVDENTPAGFRGVPTFRTGIPVPPGDLHAFATGRLDDRVLDLWLRACLALDWHGVTHQWTRDEPTVWNPTLGLLHPLARGLAETSGSSAGTAPKAAAGDGDTRQAVRRWALNPDWAVRLAAGQVASVHRDAVRRLSQAGWHAVLPSPSTVDGNADDGVAIAAALVPRCHAPMRVLTRYLAIPNRAGDDSPGITESEPASTTSTEPNGTEPAGTEPTGTTETEKESV